MREGSGHLEEKATETSSLTVYTRKLPTLQLDERWELLLTPAPGAQELLDGLVDT